MDKIRKWLIGKLFTEEERGLIIDAVCDYTDYAEDVEAEHVGDNWFIRQQTMATNIVNLVNYR